MFAVPSVPFPAVRFPVRVRFPLPIPRSRVLLSLTSIASVIVVLPALALRILLLFPLSVRVFIVLLPPLILNVAFLLLSPPLSSRINPFPEIEEVLAVTALAVASRMSFGDELVCPVAFAVIVPLSAFAVIVLMVVLPFLSVSCAFELPAFPATRSRLVSVTSSPLRVAVEPLPSIRNVEVPPVVFIPPVRASSCPLSLIVTP